MLRVGSSLVGYKIAAEDGAIGTVSDFLFDDRTWKLRWLVVDTGNWLPGRLVLVHPSAIGAPHDGNEILPVRLTKKQVEDSPDLASDRPVSEQMQRAVYGYYGWDPLWGNGYFGPGMIGAIPTPVTFVDRDANRAMEGTVLTDDDGDPHLRSLTVVKGYDIHATDGNIGHIENFLIDDTTWQIHYLIADTSNWWFGRHVLISPFAVRDIAWADAIINVNISRESVKTSPEWNPAELIEEAYQRRLHSHYQWPGYGW